MKDEEIIVIYEECKKLTADHGYMVTDYQNRVALVKKGNHTEQKLDLATIEMLDSKIKETEQNIENKLTILERI